MLNVKKVARYSTITAFKPMAIYYAVIVIVTLLLSVGIVSVVVTFVEGDVQTTTYWGFDIASSTAIFIGFVGVYGFTEDIKMLMQNGFTRRSIFFGQMLTFVILSAVCTLANFILSGAVYIANYFIGMSGMPNIGITNSITLIYGSSLNIVTENALVFALFLCISLATALFAMIFTRFNKIKVAIVLVGIFLAVMLTVNALPSGTLTSVLDVINFLLGFSRTSPDTMQVNPIMPTVTFIALSAVIATIDFRLFRGYELR